MINISTLYAHAPWSVPGVAALEITYQLKEGTSAGSAWNLNLENITIAAVSAPATRNLTITISGNGSVNSQNTQGTNYACNSSTCAPVTFNYNDTVTLFATGANSTFSAWGGQYSGNPSINPGNILMDGDKAVSATFAADPAKVKIDGDVTTYYALGTTLNTPSQDATGRVRNVVFTENITITNSHNLKLRGGFIDTAFSDNNQTGYSTISGSLKLQAGRLTVQRLKIKP